MSGQADEFCLVEPLALSSGDLIESSGTSQSAAFDWREPG